MSKYVLSPNFVSCLGSGSFGLVVKAQDELGRYSAVKIILRNDIQTSSENKDIKEISILKGKQHKNIVKIQTVFETNFDFDNLKAILSKTLDSKNIFEKFLTQRKAQFKTNLQIKVICIEMELCDMTLRDWLNERLDMCHKSRENKELLNDQLCLINDLISGLQYLHRFKILHRDLKPENILFQNIPNPTWKIGDFGLSRIFHEEASLTKTMTKNVGTPIYSAPEVGSEYDLRSDLFSLGLIIWEVSQLIPYSQRNEYFGKLVFNKNYSILTTNIVHGISETIILLTKKNVNKRMQSVEGLCKFKNKIKNKLSNINPDASLKNNSNDRNLDIDDFPETNIISRVFKCWKFYGFITAIFAILFLLIILLKTEENGSNSESGSIQITGHQMKIYKLPSVTTLKEKFIFPVDVFSLAAYDGNNSIYIICEQNTNYKNIFKFDIVSETLHYLTDLPYELKGGLAVYFARKILYFGGILNKTYNMDILEYDTSENVMKKFRHFGLPMYFPSAQVIQNGSKLLIFAFNVIFEITDQFIIKRKNWELPKQIGKSSFVAVNNISEEIIYLFEHLNKHNVNEYGQILKYNTKTEAITLIDTNIIVSSYFSTVLFDGVYAYLFVNNNLKKFNGVFKFDPLVDQLIPITFKDLDYDWFGTTSQFIKKDKKGYIFGGRNRTSGIRNLIHRIDFD